MVEAVMVEPPLPHALVLQICQLYDLDPDEVTRIVIEPGLVTIERDIVAMLEGHHATSRDVARRDDG